MSRLTTVEEVRVAARFAESAGAYMAQRPHVHSYTESGDIVPGELCALRWGVGGDAVMVFKIEEFYHPTVYQGEARVRT